MEASWRRKSKDFVEGKNLIEKFQKNRIEHMLQKVTGGKLS